MTNIIPAEELQEKLEFWQKRLRLADWDVDVKIVPLREMDGSQSGQVTYSVEHKWANIKLIDPADYSMEAMRPYVMERTLIHELLHLHMTAFKTQYGTPEGLAEEQLINALSSALIELARCGK